MNTALVGAEQPARRDAVHRGKQLVGLHARWADRLGAVLVLLGAGGNIGAQPVGDDCGAGLDVREQELSDRRRVDALDHLHAAPTEPTIALLNGDLDQGLALRTAASPRR